MLPETFTDEFNPAVVPSNIEAEQSVIGGILWDNAAIDRCDKIHAGMFFGRNHQIIWQAVCDMAAACKPVDVVTLDEHLRAAGADGQGCDLGYLIDLQQHTAGAANIRRYAQIVADKYAERQMLLAAQQIQALALERAGRTVGERQAEAVGLLTAIAEQAADVTEEKPYVQALQDSIKHKQALCDLPPGALLGFDTGLHALNRKTSGLRRGDLTVIGGRPSMGKSVLAENIARQCAKQGLKVRFQSYEMNAVDLTDRGAAAECGIDYGHLRTARMTAEEWTDYNGYINLAYRWNLLIDTEMIGIDRIAARCQAMQRKQGLDLLVVDHIHLMPRKGINEVQELDEITAKLKRLAMALNIHVLAVAQLNRAVNTRQSKRPEMSDIRGSGGIEQNANTVILPYRESYYDPAKNPNEAELILAKNRDGERGSVFVGWEGVHQRFTNHIGDWEPPPEPVYAAEADPYAI